MNYLATTNTITESAKVEPGSKLSNFSLECNET